METSDIIAAVALVVSCLTFWNTSLKKGKVKMTRPSIIFFGPDGGGKKHNKIFIRTLLYSTAEKGNYIQNMFIRLHRGENIQNFNVWVYGDKELVRGSGLFVNKNGVAFNHHFLLPMDGNNYNFLEGDSLLHVYVEIKDKKPRMIFEQKLHLKKDQEEAILTRYGGVYFDWAPNTESYYSHIDYKPTDL